MTLYEVQIDYRKTVRVEANSSEEAFKVAENTYNPPCNWALVNRRAIEITQENEDR